MKSRLIILFVLVLSLSHAQLKHEVNMLTGGGLGAIFNDRSLKQHLYNTQFFGFNYVLSKKGSVFAFNPGFHLQGNDYLASLSGNRMVHVNQNIFSLTLDVLMKFSKRNYIRVGLFMNEVFSNVLFLSAVDSQGRRTSGFGNGGIYNSYSYATIQTGVTMGLCFPFTLFHHEQKFDIKIVQQASPVVNQDYYLDKSVVGESAKVLTAKARPTFFVLALEFNLATKGLKEEKKPVEED